MHVIRRFVAITAIAIAAALTLPLGPALGFDGPAMRRPAAAIPAALHRAEALPHTPLAEAVTLALTGGLLLGVAALVRRTS